MNQFLTDIFNSIAGHAENIEIINRGGKINSFSEAFSESRSGENKSDYFFILDFSETERLFRAECTVFILHFTGSEIGRYSIIKTGNNRIWDTLKQFNVKMYLTDIRCLRRNYQT